MAFYKSKYTGTEIDQRLTQATYDDAVLAGFKGSKEEFDAILGKLKEIENKAENSTPIESENLETFNKNIVDAINELHRELQAKPDEQDVIDQGELEVFKDEIAAKYATKGELEEIVDAFDPNFVATITSELSKKLDSDKLLSGAGINIREEDGKKIVDIADDTLTKIQYSDSEVHRLETAKIPYAYDEKTQSNINIILPEGGSYLGNYGDENATVAKAAVYAGTKQLEIGSSKVHTNINTDSNVTIETSDGKKIIATTDQIPDVSDFVTKEEVPSVFETKGLTELETGESSVNIEAALGIDFTSLIEIIRENKTIIVDRNSAGDYKACIHASGNISSGNGAANLMFFIGTTPTIYQVQYVSGTFALAVDEYEFAKKSDIPDISNLVTKDELPDVSELATKEELVNKADKTELENVVKYTDISDADDTPRKTIMLDNNDTLSAYNTTGTANNIAMISKWDVVDLGSTGLPINLNGSKERPTYNDSKELALVSDIPNMSEYATTTELETKVDKVEGKQLSTEDYTTEEKEKLSKVNPDLISIAVNFPIRTSGGSDGPEDRVYTQEEILEWFGVADIAALKKQIANKGIQYIKYGIMLMGNPYYYRMPIQYAAFESANQVKLVFIGLNTNNDVVSKYEIIINLDGTIIEGNSNVKVTISNIEPEAYDDTQLKNELLAKIQELETKNTELESRLAALEGTN